jgi:hypothetical protein
MYIVCKALDICGKGGAGLLESVERVLVSKLEDLYDGYDLDAPSEMPCADGGVEKAMKAAKARRAQYESMLKRAHELLELGMYDADTFLSRCKDLQEKIHACAKEEKRLDAERPRKAEQNDGAKSALKLLGGYWSLSVEERNALLRELVEKVVYYKEKKSPPDAFHLEIYPKLPNAASRSKIGACQVRDDERT